MTETDVGHEQVGGREGSGSHRAVTRSHTQAETPEPQAGQSSGAGRLRATAPPVSGPGGTNAARGICRVPVGGTTGPPRSDTAVLRERAWDSPPGDLLPTPVEQPGAGHFLPPDLLIVDCTLASTFSSLRLHIHGALGGRWYLGSSLSPTLPLGEEEYFSASPPP